MKVDENLYGAALSALEDPEFLERFLSSERKIGPKYAAYIQPGPPTGLLIDWKDQFTR